MRIQELDGRSYAKEALLNSSDRAKLFVEATRLARAHRARGSQSNLIVSESEESRLHGDQDGSSFSEVDLAWNSS